MLGTTKRPGGLFYRVEVGMRLVLFAMLFSPALMAQNFRGSIQIKPLVPPLSKPWPVVRPSVTESTALGAAYLAGLAVGYWKKPQEIAAQWQVEQRFDPKMPRSQAAALRERWKKATERAKDWEES